MTYISFVQFPGSPLNSDLCFDIFGSIFKIFVSKIPPKTTSRINKYTKTMVTTRYFYYIIELDCRVNLFNMVVIRLS